MKDKAAMERRFWADMGEVYRIYEESMREHYRFYEVVSNNLPPSQENGSLGMQCDKIADFSKGTDAKSANLPKNPQNLHSHTAMTNFVASGGNLTESTPSQEASPAQDSKTDSESHESPESKRDSESRFKNTDSNLESKTIIESSFIDSKSKTISESRTNLESNATESKLKIISESKKFTESTAPHNPNKALPDSNNGCDSTDLAESKVLDSAIFATQKSDSNMSHEVQSASRPCRGVKNALRKCRSAFLAFLTRQGKSEALPLIAEKAAAFSGLGRAGRGEHPFLRKNTQNLRDKEVFVGQEILRNKHIENLNNTESKENTEKPRGQNLDSKIPHTTQKTQLQTLCTRLDIQPTREHFVALIERIVNLREEAILEVLKSLNKSPTEIANARAMLLEYVSAYYASAHAKLLTHIESKQLLTPFYREILASTYRIGLCMNAFFARWDREFIHGINTRLGELFSFEEALNLLEPTMERDSAGNNLQRTYSLPCHPSTTLTRESRFSCVPYMEAFPSEVGAIIEAIDLSVRNLKGLEDEIFDRSQAYIEYLTALKNAWACTDSAQLIESWRAVDYAWMRIDTPLQIGHPLEYYEDIYRHGVAPEWDLRLCTPADNKGIYALDVAQGIKSTFALLATHLGLSSQSRAFVEHSLARSKVYESIPLLFFGAENNGLFSAQVVPNDEIVSKKEGKKIFAFPLRIIAQARAKPQMRLSYEFFSKEFIARGREVLFYNENLWHSVYDISTNGHEFGHILWIDESSEEAMNGSGEFKNIEEFKATSGGIIAYLLSFSPIAKILRDALVDSELVCLDIQRYTQALERSEEVDRQIWEALFDDCIKRAVGLMAWRENLEVRPYYCEGIIHLCGMFESGVLVFDESREFGKLDINRARYVNLALWYVRTYLDLAAHYRDKKDAKLWLERFCINEQSKGVSVLCPRTSALVEHYFARYVAIGQEIYWQSPQI